MENQSEDEKAVRVRVGIQLFLLLMWLATKQTSSEALATAVLVISSYVRCMLSDVIGRFKAVAPGSE